MSGLLLDTNVVSELRRGRRAADGVLRWNAGVDAGLCYLSAVTVFELRLGAALKARRDPTQGAVLNRWIDDVEQRFEGRVLATGLAQWRRCVSLHVPDPRPLRDSLVAACALVHGLTVVTRNTRDFAGLGVALVNPWDI